MVLTFLITKKTIFLCVDKEALIDPKGTAAGGCWLMTVLAAGPLLEEELYSVAAMWVSFRVLSSEET